MNTKVRGQVPMIIRNRQTVNIRLLVVLLKRNRIKTEEKYSLE